MVSPWGSWWDKRWVCQWGRQLEPGSFRTCASGPSRGSRAAAASRSPWGTRTRTHRRPASRSSPCSIRNASSSECQHRSGEQSAPTLGTSSAQESDTQSAASTGKPWAPSSVPCSVHESALQWAPCSAHASVHEWAPCSELPMVPSSDEPSASTSDTESAQAWGTAWATQWDTQ